MRSYSIQLSVVVVLLILNQLFSIVGICYLRPVDNDPLIASGTVVEIDGDLVKLADGRIITVLGGADSELQNRIRESENRIGVETDGAGTATLYVRERRFICGLGMPMVILPVIPIDIPRYRQKMVAIGTVNAAPKARSPSLGTAPP